MTQLPSGRLAGPLYALAAFAVFATHDAIVKVLGGSYAPVQLVFFSVLFGFPLATIMLMRDGTEGNLRPHHPGWVLSRTAAAVVSGLCVFYAFSELPLAQVYAILFSMPLLVTLMAIPMLGERVGPYRGGAVLAGLAGVFVVLQPGTTPLTLAHGAALLGAVGGAFAALVVRKIGAVERSIVFLLYPMMGNFVVMGAALPFVYEPLPVAHLGGFAVMAALALIGTVFLIQAYKRAQAALVAPMQYSQIIWATLFGIVFFDERLDSATLVGTAVIIASGLYIVVREGLGASANTPVLMTRTRIGLPSGLRVGVLLGRKSGGVDGAN